MQIHFVTPLDAKLRRQVAARARAQLKSLQAIRAEEEAADRVAVILSDLQNEVLVIPRLGWRDIAAEVAREHGLALIDMMVRGRQKKLVRARQHLCYRLVAETTLSLPQIGSRLGQDHTTILHAVRKHCCENDLKLPRGMTFPQGGRVSYYKRGVA